MDIILNSDLKEIIPHTPYTEYIANNFGRFIVSMSYKCGQKDEYQYIGGMRVDASGAVEHYQNGFLGALSNAYSMHRKIEIAPHDLWVIVLTELANAIGKQVELCRPMFTNSDDKIAIMVPTNDITKIDLNEVVARLKQHIPVDTQLFVPDLVSATDDAKLMMHAALCDAVKHYYSYMTYCCGLPEIRVAGPVEDWQLLLSTVAELAQLFKNIGYVEVVEYLIRVGDVFDKIQRSYFAEDITFWKGIFTQKNIGSGGELEINGWITDLYFGDRGKPRKIENFLTSIAIVPYTNMETGREFKAVHGGFKRVVNAEGYVQTKYDQLVFENVK